MSAKVKIDPTIGEVWEHEDGCSIYVVNRSKKPDHVKIQRRPFGDSQAEPLWVSIETFRQIQRGRLGRKVGV